MARQVRLSRARSRGLNLQKQTATTNCYPENKSVRLINLFFVCRAKNFVSLVYVNFLPAFSSESWRDGWRFNNNFFSCENQRGILRKFDNGIFMPSPRKNRYFFFLLAKWVNLKIWRNIKPLAKTCFPPRLCIELGILLRSYMIYTYV